MNKVLKGYVYKSGENEYTAIASTDAVDRYGEIVDQSGWDTSAYMKNPVMLWAHDSHSLPVAKCLSIDLSQPGKMIHKFAFADASMNPMAPYVKNSYDAGFLNAFSVGFMANEMKENKITKAELLEISLVPVPANQEALRLNGYDLGFYKSIDFGDIRTDIEKAVADLVKEKGVVPANVSTVKADEGEKWSKPTLTEFSDKGWGDLTPAEKKHIAGHYAWAKELPPDSFGDLKLPHHEAKSGHVVWNGVKAAMGALLGARGGVSMPDEDKKKVHAHLAAHYKQFDKTPPELGKSYEEGDEEGTPIALALSEHSKKMRKLVRKAMGHMADALESHSSAVSTLEDLMEAASTPTDGGADDPANDDAKALTPDDLNRVRRTLNLVTHQASETTAVIKEAIAKLTS